MARFEALLTEATVREYPLVVSDENRRLADAFRRRGLPYCVAVEVGTFDSVKPYVARGLGIAVLPGICPTEADRLVLDAVPLPKELQGDTTYGVVVRRDKRPLNSFGASSRSSRAGGLADAWLHASRRTGPRRPRS